MELQAARKGPATSDVDLKLSARAASRSALAAELLRQQRGQSPVAGEYDASSDSARSSDVPQLVAPTVTTPSPAASRRGRLPPLKDICSSLMAPSSSASRSCSPSPTETMFLSSQRIHLAMGGTAADDDVDVVAAMMLAELAR
eukprot:TRINITY_DN4254_c0_g1_i4.p2 TRINITY_DN4254_c0_g1~~TRINITY_DN4254_c0_g1_i4.p2  ORF type:complete len:143 (-),score=68.13 TRINITY_DN4254_c0_g1_i4:87-515(-)